MTETEKESDREMTMREIKGPKIEADLNLDGLCVIASLVYHLSFSFLYHVVSTLPLFTCLNFLVCSI